MKKLFRTFLICIPLCIINILVVKHYNFNNNCEKFLQSACETNSLEEIESNLSEVIKYAEANNLTAGNTSAFSNKPANSIDIWFNNINRVYGEILFADSLYNSYFNSNTEQLSSYQNNAILEIKNDQDISDSTAVIKIRRNTITETRKSLLEEYEEDGKVFIPVGIQLFPHNKIWFFIYIIASIIVFIDIFYIIPGWIKNP